LVVWSATSQGGGEGFYYYKGYSEMITDNPHLFAKYYNTQPNKTPFRVQGMKETLWRLENDEWPFYYKHNGVWVKTTLYKGMVTDLASIPWLAQAILRKGKDGVHRSGTVPHDFHYMMEKVDFGGKLFAYISSNSCTHKNEAWVDGKWIPFDMYVSKEQADQYMFDIIESTPETYIKSRVKWAILTAFKTPKAHRVWRNATPNHVINPERCG
jgi:hypothetical protein